MSEEHPPIHYHRPPPHPDRWQLRRLTIYLVAVCICAALYCGFMSLVLSQMLATKTAAFKQFEQQVQAQAATRPTGTTFEWPRFNGQALVPVPLLRLPTTYFSLGFAAAAVALSVLYVRWPDHEQ